MQNGAQDKNERWPPVERYWLRLRRGLKKSKKVLFPRWARSDRDFSNSKSNRGCVCGEASKNQRREICLARYGLTEIFQLKVIPSSATSVLSGAHSDFVSQVLRKTEQMLCRQESCNGKIETVMLGPRATVRKPLLYAPVHKVVSR